MGRYGRIHPHKYSFCMCPKHLFTFAAAIRNRRPMFNSSRSKLRGSSVGIAPGYRWTAGVLFPARTRNFS
jgi:hypothetical protein